MTSTQMLVTQAAHSKSSLLPVCKQPHRASLTIICAAWRVLPGGSMMRTLDLLAPTCTRGHPGLGSPILQPALQHEQQRLHNYPALPTGPGH